MKGILTPQAAASAEKNKGKETPLAETPVDEESLDAISPPKMTTDYTAEFASKRKFSVDPSSIDWKGSVKFAAVFLGVVALGYIGRPVLVQVPGAVWNFAMGLIGQKGESDDDRLVREERLKAEIFGRLSSTQRMDYGDAVKWEIVLKHCFVPRATNMDKQICEYGLDDLATILSLRKDTIPQPANTLASGIWSKPAGAEALEVGE